MSEKRRVLGSTGVAANNNDTPTRGARASPSTASAAGVRVRAIINNTAASSPSIAGSSPSGNTVGTPSSRTAPGRGAFSPAASAAVRARARVLGYDHQQESPLAGSPSNTGSPLVTEAVLQQRGAPCTPGAGAAHSLSTPSSSCTHPSPSLVSSTISAARAQVSARKTPLTHAPVTDSAGLSVRKVRAASTPPHNDSPSLSRPVSRPASPKRRAFPTSEGGTHQRSSSPASMLADSSQTKRMPRVRPISGVRSNTAGIGSLPRADPVKPPMYHSKSMTSRPPSAAPNALLPSPTIRTTPSSIFPSSSSSTLGTAGGTKPGSSNGSAQAPLLSPRPPSPVRIRPRSPVRPASPRRGEVSHYAQPNSPQVLDIQAHAVSRSPPIASIVAKRPSTSSQSSSSVYTADTSGSTNTTTTTAPTCFSPDLLCSEATDHHFQPAFADSSVSASKSAFHRARRRSHSTSSSISSTSGLSNISKTRALSSGNAARHTRSGSSSGGTHGGVGIGIKIPSVGSPSMSVVSLSTSPRFGALASPHRQGQAPSSPGKGFFSEAEKMQQQAHLDAKVHRKILDLEITNTSLLAINASLEKAKAKQSTELRTLRRQLRDRASFAPPLSSANLLSPLSDDCAWNPSISDDDHEPELTWDELLKEDDKFADIVRLVDAMNRKGQEALERTVTSEQKSLGGPKVLSHFTTPDTPRHKSLGSSRKTLGSTIGSGKATSSSSMHSSAGSRGIDSTLEPDSTSSETENEDEATDYSSVQDTSRTSSHHVESSDGDVSLTSSFDVSRAMTSNSEFSISID